MRSGVSDEIDISQVHFSRAIQGWDKGRLVSDGVPDPYRFPSPTWSCAERLRLAETLLLR